MQELFDGVVDLSPERVEIDDTPVTEDVFIDDNLFRDTDIKEKGKQNIDDILQEVNHGDIRIAQTIVEIKDRLKPASKKKRL